MKGILGLLLIACFWGVIFSAKNTALYDPSKSAVYLLNKENFDKQITKHRNKLVSVIHFYKHDDGESKTFSTEYEKFGAEMQGVFKIGAIDCYKEWELCEKEKVTKFPTVRVYPPNPIPAFDYEGEYSSKAITGSAGRFVGNKVIEVNSTNIHKFIQDTPSVPKALLFTDKPTVPLIYKALSVTFDQKIFLGIVRKEESELFERYNIKATPKIILIKPTEKKHSTYSGEMKYSPIFDFLNVFVETFVPGGEQLDNEKPWTRETFPELTSKSGNDICFSHDSAMCAIYISENAPDQASISVVEQLLKENKETNFKYMWLNINTQPAFAKLLAGDSTPRLAVFSHGKRKKYLIHEGPFIAKDILRTFERINNGDARFNQIKQEIPSLN